MLSLIGSPFLKFSRNEVSLLSLAGILSNEVLKEEQLEHSKNDDHLDNYYCPKCPANGHIPKSINIETDHTTYKV